MPGAPISKKIASGSVGKKSLPAESPSRQKASKSSLPSTKPGKATKSQVVFRGAGSRKA